MNLSSTLAAAMDPSTAAAAPDSEDISIVEFPLIREESQLGQPQPPPPPPQDLTAFLRVMYNLNVLFSKFVTVGLFKEFNFRVAVLFHKQGNQKYVLMDEAQFIVFKEAIDSITFALVNSKAAVERRRFTLMGVKVVIRNIYFKPHVEIQDVERKTSIIFNEQEWLTFKAILPCVSRYLEQLSCVESYLIEHIDNVMRSDSVYVSPPQQINGWDADRLHDEIVLYKKGGGGGGVGPSLTNSK